MAVNLGSKKLKLRKNMEELSDLSDLLRNFPGLKSDLEGPLQNFSLEVPM